MFRYKTRADSNPRGKPRIYFCCHPEDFPVYFEPLSGELLEQWDCAVWYRPDRAGAGWSREDAADLLSQMQLVVTPVSEAFLYEEDHPGRREFDLAVQLHIPVLPILVDPGLAGEFNRRCGTMQCLDRTSQDVTEIPYREKMKRFLELVLVPDDLAQQVRDAFDAYIFLSYRKKDRRYAQELMGLIHANPFCRDIAIWYDEFLNPGEDFNDTIAQALEKSRLFALAVTPNLVNEKNYVMDVEYPMAREAGKAILPAQLCPTDRDALERCYDGLPRCVDAQDQTALSDSLLEALRDIAVRENDGDPQHLLFIGLAYLGGIDVEVNTGRGVELITRAAEMGLPQAMAKLVSLYCTGAGVALDQERAIAWQERLTAARKGQPGQERALLEDNRVLASLCWECQQYDRAGQACREAIQCLTRWKPEPGEVREVTLWYHDLMGRIARAQSRLEQAREHFQAHERLSARWAAEEPGIPALDSWMVSYDRLGQLSMTQGNLEQALEQFTRGRDLARQADEQVHTLSSMNRRLTMELQCGKVLLRQGRLNDALAAYEGLLGLAGQLAETGESQAVSRYIWICEDLSQLCGQLGRVAAGQAHARRGLRVAEALAQEFPTLNHQQTLSDLCLQYADLCFLAHTPGQALDPDILRLYQKGGDIARQAALRTGSARGWLDVSHALERASRWYGLDGQEEQELRALTQAMEAAQRAVEARGGVQARRVLANRLQQLARLSRESMDVKREEEYTRQCFRLRQEIARETDSAEDLVDLAGAHQSMSLWAAAGADDRAEMDHMEESIRLCQEAVRREPTVTHYRKVLAAYHHNLALRYFQRDDTARYRTCEHRALELEEELVKEDGSLMAWWSLAGRYEELMSYGSQGLSWEEICPDCQRYLRIYEDLALRDGSREQMDRLASAYSRASGVARTYRRWDAALDWQKKNAQVWENVLAEHPEDLYAYDRAAEGQRYLALVCLAMEDLQQVWAYWREYRSRVMAFPRCFSGCGSYRNKSLTEYAGERTRLLMQDCDEQARKWKEEGKYQLAQEAWKVALDCAKAFLELQPGDPGGRDRMAFLLYALGDADPEEYVLPPFRQAMQLWEELAREFPGTQRYANNAQAVREILEGP